MTGARGVAADLGLGLLALVPSVVLYRGFFESAAYWPVAAVAGIVGTGCAVAAFGWRWSPLVKVLSAVAGYVVVVLPVVLLARGGEPWTWAGAAREVATGTARGWVTVLSVGLPAPVDHRVLVPLALVTFLAAYASAGLAIGSRSPVAPAGPPVLAYGIGLVVVATVPGTSLGLAAALAAVVLAQVLYRARPASEVSVRWGAVACAVVVVAVGSGFAVRATSVFGTGALRADPRPLDLRAAETPRVLTPLADVRPQTDLDPPRPVCAVTLAADAPGLPGVAIAVLDRFDGTIWTTGGEFRAAGQRLAGAPGGPASRRVNARITVARLRSPFVPVLGQPVRLDFPGARAAVGFDEASGSLYSPDIARGGAVYDVTAELLSADPPSRAVRPSENPDDEVYRRLPPGLPPVVRQLLHEVTDPEPTPTGKLAALNTFLRGLPYNRDARPGHSYADIARVIAARQTDDDGYAEQHAAAFAVMARALGYPARVVVGYRIPTTAGVHLVSTKDATAWAEVRFPDAGWVPYDPTDPTRTERRTPPRAVSNPTPADEPGPPDLASAANRPESPHQDQPPGAPWSVVVATGAGSAVLAAALVVLGAKSWRRHRRRRRGDDADRVIGAWAECLDLLTELRVPAARHRTPGEVASDAVTALGPRVAPLADLAEAATAAVFGPRHLGPDDVRLAWATERGLRRALYRGARLPLRPINRLNPRPLRKRWRY
ncbi:transglutaminaseTgpA domain-containing protein [Actinokineospora auranticolor]|uniref:Uncharacterized protein DUF4129 n=1 Tax=Actinokineospora auranticolor TaxID=155976 RepID=A0A2S6H107_9PSEU|nr:transglutaminase domain-containing protein [Actinokineospora auranticolor]PPK71097.1 uncharacterized protein DUF4129 [Actinokineospora auranticolor]